MKRLLVLLLLFAAGYGVQAQPFVFVFLNKKLDKAELPKEQVDKLMEGHMANIQRLAKENKLIAAGPFEGGGGIFIFRSDSKKQVEEWVSTDPAVQARRWDIEMFLYTPRKGSVCPASEPIEMTPYNFARYEINITKYSMATMSEAIKEHDLYVKQLATKTDIIAEGSFGADEGGILITRGDPQKELIEADPILQKEFMTVTFKELFIAKGAFCENK
jgi:uncharacterized protein YciI